MTVNGSSPARDCTIKYPGSADRSQLLGQSSCQRVLEKPWADWKVLCSADQSYSSGNSPEVPSFPTLTSHLPIVSFCRAADITAGNSLYTFAPSLHKLRKTTEGEKQSSMDSWAWCELHYKTCLLSTDGSTESRDLFLLQDSKHTSQFRVFACRLLWTALCVCLKEQFPCSILKMPIRELRALVPPQEHPAD